jgi:hypothetical protein
MGRSYWFECSKCGYRAAVSGGADRGLNFFAQTILCLDCKQLFDALTRWRVPDEAALRPRLGLRTVKAATASRNSRVPPSFAVALNRLPYRGVKRYKWLSFQVQCPVSPHHRVQHWNEPGRCPRCGAYLEKNALPYRLWD